MIIQPISYIILLDIYVVHALIGTRSFMTKNFLETLSRSVTFCKLSARGGKNLLFLYAEYDTVTCDLRIC